MSLKISVESPDIERELALLRVYPEIVNKHVKPALEESTLVAAAAIVPGIPIETGHAISRFGTRVTGSGVPSLGGKGGIEGDVGWWGRNAPWYINVVEYGARPHPLREGTSVRKVKARKIFERAWNEGSLERAGEGVPVFVQGKWKTMQIHPGLAGRGFLRRGAAEAQPMIEEIMGLALDGVCQELAIGGSHE